LSRKWKYCIFVLFASVFYYLQIKFPNILFMEGSIDSWNIARRCIVSLTCSLLLFVMFFLVTNRNELAPYFAKFMKFKPLLYLLVKRDFKAKYKRSFLGIVWTILNPLLLMLVLTIVFSHIFRFDIKNFPVYLLSGQLIFAFFSESTTLSMNSILGAGSLIKKINLPKYIFPISRALSSLVNLMLSFIALILVMLITRAPFHWTILLAPIPIIFTFLFSLGVGLIMSAAIVFFRDMMYLYNIFLTALTYFTPIFYPISIIPDKYRFLISLNPMYHYVEYFRTVAIYGGLPTSWQNIICSLMSIASLSAGLYVFYKKQDRFILYI